MKAKKDKKPQFMKTKTFTTEEKLKKLKNLIKFVFLKKLQNRRYKTII